MSVVTTEDDLLAVARRELGSSSRSTFTLQRHAHGFVLVADHPASAGLMIETGTLDHDLAAHRISSWMDHRAVAVADAAAELMHSDTVAGVQALAEAFDWPTAQVRTVAFLLFARHYALVRRPRVIVVVEVVGLLSLDPPDSL
jgi:hypothetical protein